MAKGLYTNSELVDSLINDLNNLLKEALNGQYIQACCAVHVMAQKLLNLRKTIDADLENRNQVIEKLKRELRETGHEVQEIPIENLMTKDGAENGGN